ncbi:hypothetical protein ACFSX9_13135, partial [Flavobacterium ardleyense]
VAYNPLTEGDDNSTADSPCEIHLYKINGGNVEIVKKIQIADKSILSSKLYFNSGVNSFITVSDTNGMSVITLDGQIAFKDNNLKVNEYSVEKNCLLMTDKKTISVYELTE